MPKFCTVWYFKPEIVREALMGPDFLRKVGKMPTMATLPTTHAPVAVVQAADLDEVFYKMQGENWSPDGEAIPLIEALGLSHTTMCVGDVVVVDGGGYMVAGMGWQTLASE